VGCNKHEIESVFVPYPIVTQLNPVAVYGSISSWILGLNPAHGIDVLVFFRVSFSLLVYGR
jgi:hypothetical protein